MKTNEIWRLIPSLPDYLASSDGRLMRLPHLEPMPKGGFRTYGGETTFGQWDGDRYVLPYKGKTYKVARLICEAFNGPPSFSDAVCMHLDENSRNNAASNLKWGTQKENLNAPGFIAYCRERTGDNNPYVKGRKKRMEAAR